jgi:hypothetical protein
MTAEQGSQLIGYLMEPNTTIVSIEYPAGWSADRTYFDNLKVVSVLKQAEGSWKYVDIIRPDGTTLHTTQEKVA